MSDKDKVKSFSELLDSQVKSISDDKYDIKNFGDSKKEGRLELKWKRIKATLFGDAGVSGKFVQGVTMGATVGLLLVRCLAYYLICSTDGLFMCLSLLVAWPSVLVSLWALELL